MSGFVALPGLPAWLQPVHQRLCHGVSRLPTAPPSLLAALLLDRFLLPRLPAAARQALTGHCVALSVTDLGLHVLLQLGRTGFSPAPQQTPPRLSIAAPSTSYLRLLRGDDDPDRLFFERALVMEGDTELGLVLKNTLDAIGPLWPRRRH